ncbi:hypothetical protein D3C76_1504530 [compost metagenome]
MEIHEKTTTPEKHVVVCTPTTQYAFVDNLAVLIAVRYMLGLHDVKFGKAINRGIGEQLQDIWPTIASLPKERPIADIAIVLPGHTFIQPVGVLRHTPPRSEVTFWCLSEILRQHFASPCITKFS